LKFVSRTIPRCGGYNTPQLALGFIPVILTGMLFLLLAVSPAFADYSGHVASFKSKKNVVTFVNKMKTKGFDAYYQKDDVPGKGEFYRAYIGGFKTLPLAQKALTKLKKSGDIDYFHIQETSEKNNEIVKKETEITTQENESAQESENKTGIIIKQDEPALKPEGKMETAAQGNEPVQETESKNPTSIDTSKYYSGIKGIILTNGKVIKGKILSIDSNDVLKIRTIDGEILSFSFMKDIKNYITEPEP
jgi:hypothetical protein